MTANARSLELKIPSLIDMFTDGEAHIALLTETWIKSSNYERIKEDIELNAGLKLFEYNRPGKRRGGGVGIIVDPNKIKLEENKFARRGYEIVSVKGKIKGLLRNIVMYCIYLPPNITAKKAD